LPEFVEYSSLLLSFGLILINSFPVLIICAMVLFVYKFCLL
jgi:hypothetical protein